MTYTVSGGGLNSTQTKPNLERPQQSGVGGVSQCSSSEKSAVGELAGIRGLSVWPTEMKAIRSAAAAC